MTLKSTLINASFMIAAALPLSAMAEPEIFVIPDAVSARADHCGFASEDAYKEGMKSYQNKFIASVRAAGTSESDDELLKSIDPETPNFELLRRYKDKEDPTEFFNSTYLAKPSALFSRCQAMALAKSIQSTLLIFSEYTEEHGRTILFVDPPKP